MEQKVTHSLVQSLRRIPDFDALDDQTLLTIIGESINLAWPAGTTIFKAGDPGDALYIMLEGECSIHDGRSSSEGEVSHPVAGDSFGELSLLLDAAHARTATAITDCEILVLPKDSFEALLEANPMLKAHFDSVLASRRSTIKPEVPKAG